MQSEEKKKNITNITYALLAIVGAAPFVLPDGMVIPTVRAAEFTPPPIVFELTGVVRDFREWNVENGHIDFGIDDRADALMNCEGIIWNGNVANELGDDHKPVFTGDGFAVETQWTNSSGRPICYTQYDATRGDRAGVKSCDSTGGIESEASFNQWFNDVADVNMSSTLTLRLIRQVDGSYLFDDKFDLVYSSRGGFFPVDSRLFGNPPVKQDVDHNFHFTFELHAQFTYDAGAKQMFQFVGDDDVWVFINGKLVIDLGGIHSFRKQYVDLNRLGLTDGKTYPLDFFFAQRSRTKSNFRVVTNLMLESKELTSAAEQLN